MKGKGKQAKEAKRQDPSQEFREYRIRPINEEDYPWEVETENFIYHRLYCTLYAVLYEKYRGDVRLSYHILPQEKDIYDLKLAIEYADKQRGEQICSHQLV